MVGVNFFDVFVALVAACLVILGFAKGAARISLGLIALVAGFFVATQFQDPVADAWLRVGVGAGPAAILAWGVLYVGTVIAGGLLGGLLARALKVVKLAWADRIGGASLGIVAASMFAATLVHLLATAPTLGPRVMGRSVLAPYAAALADAGNLTVPDELSDRYRNGVEAVRVIWRAQRERAGSEPIPQTED